MPRARRRAEPIAAPDDEDALAARDSVMARLLAARAAATSAIAAIDECGSLFVNPEDDASGRKRKEAIDDALEEAGALCRALEHAEEELSDADMKAGEPWEDDVD
jgi:hypothetical protein